MVDLSGHPLHRCVSRSSPEERGGGAGSPTAGSSPPGSRPPPPTVTVGLWAWGAARYPKLLQPDRTIAAAAAARPVLTATLINLGAGAVLLVPSLIWLHTIFQRDPARGPTR